MSLSLHEMNLCRFCNEREGLRGGSAKVCSLCNGLFDRIEQISMEVTGKLKDYQYDSFLIGVAMPARVIDNEDELRARLRIKGKESIKSQFNSILTKKIVSLTGKKVDYSMPEVTVLVSLSNGAISVASRSIWLTARYKKIKRGVSQRSTTCRDCNGLGCVNCSYKGKSGTTVESLASSFFCDKFRAESCSFVWLGGEDENSLVGGSGRPFFVEIIQPQNRFASVTISKKRSLALASEGVQLLKIRRLERKFSEVPLFDISCKVFLRSDDALNITRLPTEEIEKHFSDCIVGVQLNRKYRIVQRLVHSIRTRVHGDGRVELLIECEGGIPIKKLITGQDSTVEPNLSNLVKSYHIDPDRPFDILDVKLRGAGVRGSSSDEKLPVALTDIS